MSLPRNEWFPYKIWVTVHAETEYQNPVLLLAPGPVPGGDYPVVALWVPYN